MQTVTEGEQLIKMDIIHKELSYKIVGALISVRKELGLGHKESVYQRALAEELNKRGIVFVREPSIQVLSPSSGKMLGVYRPDFLVEDKIIIELKVERMLTDDAWTQLYSYLRNSKYELAYLVNFSNRRMEIKRIIYSNSKKQPRR